MRNMADLLLLLQVYQYLSWEKTPAEIMID